MTYIFCPILYILYRNYKRTYSCNNGSNKNILISILVCVSFYYCYLYLFVVCNGKCFKHGFVECILLYTKRL